MKHAADSLISSAFLDKHAEGEVGSEAVEDGASLAHRLFRNLAGSVAVRDVEDTAGESPGDPDPEDDVGADLLDNLMAGLKTAANKTAATIAKEAPKVANVAGRTASELVSGILSDSGEMPGEMPEHPAVAPEEIGVTLGEALAGARDLGGGRYSLARTEAPAAPLVIPVTERVQYTIDIPGRRFFEIDVLRSSLLLIGVLVGVGLVIAAITSKAGKKVTAPVVGFLG